MAQPAHHILPARTEHMPMISVPAMQWRLAGHIRAIGREAWNACFHNEPESYDYLLAVEEAGLKGFALRYAVLECGGQVCAAMPAFFMDYSLGTTLGGAPRRFIQRVQKIFPRFLVLKLACLGSPVTESGMVGFHEDVPESRQGEMLRLLLEGFSRDALRQGSRLIGVRDVPQWQKPLWDKMAYPLGFRSLPSMPTAYLDIDFSTIGEYISCLSGGTRKDMRRKLRTLEALRIEHRTNIDDVLPQVQRLYLDARARGDFEFEELTPEYFSGVLKRMGAEAHCTLYYAGEQLLAANLMLKNRHTLLDKFFCMDGAVGREYNLYFLSWFTNVRYCLEHGLTCYQSGQAGYDAKRRLGSRLSPNWLLFRHANPILGGLLRLMAPLLAMGEDV
ncbi:MAG: GNAT family N-acetyltransferase [Pseudomonadota bacterium]|nr:GNAT family N-acetyltransferase [Pseudomonadota bacterium]MDE3037534.1 GNAT family N-acetyltransferase [Pseudomonadota bacterium]